MLSHSWTRSAEGKEQKKKMRRYVPGTSSLVTLASGLLQSSTSPGWTTLPLGFVLKRTNYLQVGTAGKQLWQRAQ